MYRRANCGTSSINPKGNRSLLRLDLGVVEFDGSFAAEDGDFHFQLLLVFVDFLDLRAEAGERSIDDLYGLAKIVADFRRFHAALFFDLAQDASHLVRLQCLRLGLRLSDKT